MAAAADKEPVRVERETPIAAPPRSRCRPAVADAGREHRAGRRARRVGGVPTLAAGGAWAWMPFRGVWDASPSFEIDHPAHARAVRGVEVVSGEHVRRGEQGWAKGKARSPGGCWLQNCGSGRPIMSDEKMDERTAKIDSKGDRQVGF